MKTARRLYKQFRHAVAGKRLSRDKKTAAWNLALIAATQKDPDRAKNAFVQLVHNVLEIDIEI